MIKDFDLKIGTAFIFGHDAELRIGSELAARGISRVLIHYGSGAYLQTSGLLDTVRKSLSNNGISFVELGGVQPNPRLTLVREGVNLVEAERVEAIVAIGGGSVIDSAKAIGLGAANGDDVWDYFTGVAEPSRTLPVAAVPTLSASGSESSKVVVLSNEDEQRKMFVSSPIVRPAFAFMDPELTASVPAGPTACGIVDMFSHVCERYFSDDYDWGIVDRICEGVLKTLVDVGPRCLANLNDYELRAQLMWISTIAQNNIVSIGRDEDWSTHTMANEISALYDTAHGETLSIVMPSWMRVASERAPRRFARYAREVFGLDTDVESHDMQEELEIARQGINATEAFFISLGMPVSFKDVALPVDGVEQMLDRIAFFGDDQAIGSVVRLNRDDCRSIFKRALYKTVDKRDDQISRRER